MSARTTGSILALSQGVSEALRIVVPMKLFLFAGTEQIKNFFAAPTGTGVSPGFPLCG
jgi:hypothetical protein